MIWCFRQGSFGCWCCLWSMWVAGCFKYLCLYAGITQTPIPTHTHPDTYSRRSSINANKWKHKYFQRFVVWAKPFCTLDPVQINGGGGAGIGVGVQGSGYCGILTGPYRWIISAVMARFLRARPFFHSSSELPAAKRFLSSPTQLNIEIYI